MREERTPSPECIPPIGDPGDETARRYRYQWAYAAIMCCSLLDETLDVSEVFCEHHEDVLLKHNNGKFSGLQVKTRAPDQNPWKTSDKDIRKSFAKFVTLEGSFPGHFQSFKFLTNHPLHSAENGKSLPYVLRKINEARSTREVEGPSKKFLQQIAQETGYSDTSVFDALIKTQASHDLPKFEDIFSRLVNTLTGVWNKAEEIVYEMVVKTARALVEECGRASSLAHDDILPAYIPAVSKSDDQDFIRRRDGKRITKGRLQQVLNQGVDSTRPLDDDPKNIIEPGEGDITLLRKKLDAGGFSAVSLNSSEDLRNKADYLGLTLIKKYGRDSGLQRYGHLKSIVLSDAATAHETSQDKDDPFGSQMLSILRTLFEQRIKDGSQLYGCSREHLEGFAYSLTSQCKIVWSHARPWEIE